MSEEEKVGEAERIHDPEEEDFMNQAVKCDACRRKAGCKTQYDWNSRVSCSGPFLAPEVDHSMKAHPILDEYRRVKKGEGVRETKCWYCGLVMPESELCQCAWTGLEAINKAVNMGGIVDEHCSVCHLLLVERGIIRKPKETSCAS